MAAMAWAFSSPRSHKARPQGPDDLLAAIEGVVLFQLPLALDILDLDAEADDLPQQPVHEGTGAVK
jgi:hypothetical protein